MDILKPVLNRLFLFIFLITACMCFPGTPRIYNVLISSKKNLAPSHAVPVYEPVLRTTSVGIAFPSFAYISPVQRFVVPIYNEGSVPNTIPKEIEQPPFPPRSSNQAPNESEESNTYQLRRLYQNIPQYTNYNEEQVPVYNEAPVMSSIPKEIEEPPFPLQRGNPEPKTESKDESLSPYQLNMQRLYENLPQFNSQDKISEKYLKNEQ